MDSLWYRVDVKWDGGSFNARAAQAESIHDALALYDTLVFKYGKDDVQLVLVNEAKHTETVLM